MGSFDDINRIRKFNNETNDNTARFRMFNVDDNGKEIHYTGKEERLSKEDIEALFPAFNNSEFRFLIFWDDMAQFTSLGLMDVLNENGMQDDAFNYGTFSFLNRSNEYTNGLKFVQGALEEYKKELIDRFREVRNQGFMEEIDKREAMDIEASVKANLTFSLEELEKIYKDRYFEIIQHSPFNGILNSILISLHTISSITFVFKHKFEGMKRLAKEFNDTFNVSGKTHIQVDNLEDNSIDEILLKYVPNVIFACDMGTVWESIVKNNLSKIELFCNPIHNGLTDEYLALMDILSDGRVGLNQCRLVYIKDTISINTPRAGAKYDFDDEEEASTPQYTNKNTSGV